MALKLRNSDSIQQLYVNIDWLIHYFCSFTRICTSLEICSASRVSNFVFTDIFFNFFVQRTIYSSALPNGIWMQMTKSRTQNAKAARLSWASWKASLYWQDQQPIPFPGIEHVLLKRASGAKCHLVSKQVFTHSHSSFCLSFFLSFYRC